MRTFAERIKHTLGLTLKLGKTHPFTFVVLLAGTVAAFIWSLFSGLLDGISRIRIYSSEIDSVFGHILLWLLMLLFAVFLTENCVTKNIYLKASVTAVSAVATFLYSGMAAESIIFKKMFQAMADRVGNEHQTMFTCGYFFVTVLMSLYMCYKKLSDSFSFGDYIFGVLSGGFLVCVIYAVVNIGLLTLTFVFTELLFGDFEDIFMPPFAVVTGLYLCGALLVTVTESQTDIPKFVNILFRYVLFGMSLAAYVIVYLYVIKIIVLWDFPSNSIYSILTSLFCFSIPLAYLNLERTEGFIGLMSRILPYVFAPLILLQIYTVAVRVHQYGLTPSRYLGIVFIVFETGYIVWHAVARDTIRHIPVVLSVLVFFLAFMPFSNALFVPKLTQTFTLDRCLKGRTDGLSAEAGSRMYSAYSYLCDIDNGKDYLTKRYSEEEITYIREATRKNSDGLDEYDLSESARYSCLISSIDTSGYDHVMGFIYEEPSDSDNHEPDVSRLPVFGADIEGLNRLSDDEGGQVGILDLTEFTGRMKNGEFDDYDDPKEPVMIEQDGKRYVIRYAWINYDTVTGEILNLNIDGYVLY